MKIRHYMLLFAAALAIAFMQPLILLLGGLTLIATVLAVIYADLDSDRQRGIQRRLAGLLAQLSGTARHDDEPVVKPASSKSKRNVLENAPDTEPPQALRVFRSRRARRHDSHD